MPKKKKKKRYFSEHIITAEEVKETKWCHLRRLQEKRPQFIKQWHGCWMRCDNGRELLWRWCEMKTDNDR